MLRLECWNGPQTSEGRNMFTEIFRACMRFVHPASQRDAAPAMFSDVLNKTGDVRTNVTPRRVRVTIGDVQEQKVLHILSVCL